MIRDQCAVMLCPSTDIEETAVKRLLIMTVTVAMVAGAVATAEAKQPRRSERTVQGSYQAYPTPITGCNSVAGSWACLIVQTRRTEAFFSATVADTHGQPVLVNVRSQGRWLATFCGKTNRPIAVTPGAALEFDIGQGRAPFENLLPCPQHVIKTAGTIKVTLSNRR